MSTSTVLPAVSVVLAVRNGARYLADAFESVLVAQTHRPLEVLVVDDQSSDGTREIAESFAAQGVRFIANPERLGIAGSRNLGVKLARGELLAFASHDDLWEPDKLRLQAACLQAQPELFFCLAHVRCFVEPGEEPPRGFAPDRLNVSLPGYLIESLLARRTAFDRVGWFDTTLRQADDTDWFARAQDLGVARAILPECLVHKRMHATSNTYQRPHGDRLYELVQVVHRSVQRKRLPATASPEEQPSS